MLIIYLSNLLPPSVQDAASSFDSDLVTEGQIWHFTREPLVQKLTCTGGRVMVPTWIQ